jgi:hypothetical protein
MLVRLLLNISKLERPPTAMGMPFSFGFTERSADAKNESISICKNIKDYTIVYKKALNICQIVIF